MFLQPSASASASASTRSSRPIATLGLTVKLPEKPQLEMVVASIKRQDKNITLPDLSPGARNMAVLLEAFNAIPDGSDITLYIRQFATNPHDEPREDLIQLWNTVKSKVKVIVWDQNKFFKSFVASLSEELKSDSKIARCEFQNCDKTSSCATDQPNPGFSFPKPEDLKAMSFFQAVPEEDATAQKECADAMLSLSQGHRV